jgi:phosphatidylglycerophosphate synthase
MLRLATGLGAAVICALGPDTWQHIGAGVFLLSVLMDRADGELARLSGKISEQGHRYDLIADTVCNAAIFLGIGIGLRHDWLGAWSILLGLVAGLAISAIFLTVLDQERQKGLRAAELGSMAGFDPDDGILAVPLFLWLGFAQELIIAGAVGAPLFAGYVFLRARQRNNRDG